MTPLAVNQNNNLATKQTKRHPSGLTVVFANVLTSNREIVPDGFGT
jgi:hypothetical protein